MVISFRRKLCLALVVIFIFSFASCGQKAPDPVDSNTSTPTQSATTEPVDSATPTPVAADPFGKYDETVTLTTVRQIPNPAIFKVPEGSDFEKNAWMDKVKEDMNIQVKYDWMVDDTQIFTRMNTMIASGEIPDFFMTDLANAAQLYDAGLLQEVGTAFDTYAWDKVKGIYDEAGSFTKDVITFDGKQYGIPVLSGSREFSNVLYVREDWLTNLGLPVPKTIDDVIKTSIAFTKDDPDKNGKDDTFGLAVNGDTTGAFLWHLGFFNAYNSFPTIWTDDGKGNLVYGSTTPETKTALSALRDLYAAGGIDPEFVTETYWSIYEPAGAGKFGMMYGPYYIAIAPLGTYKLANYDTSGNWIPLPLLGKDGPAPVQAGAATSSFYVISKDCKNPDAVIKLLNFWYDKFYFCKDEETYYSLINERNGNPTYQFSPIMSYREYHNLGLNLASDAILKGTRKIEDCNFLEVDMYNKIKAFFDGDKNQWIHERDMVALRDVVDVYKQNNNFVQNLNYAPPDTVNMVGAEMTNLYAKEMEYFIKIITGAIPLDDFDKFVSEWKQGGGEAYTNYVNEWYKGVK